MMIKMNELDQFYWEQKYLNHQTGWDIGYASTPIQAYIDQLENKELKILIPGVGNGYEAEYIWKNGFKNLFVLDLAKTPLKNLKSRIDIPRSQVLNENFFELHDTFDLILEQTFFCALHPALRQNYAHKMSSLLNANGKLAGLLFDFELTDQGPPFGGSKKEYLSYFSPYFKIKTFDRAYNSIKPRMDRELFFIFEKK